MFNKRRACVNVTRNFNSLKHVYSTIAFLFHIFMTAVYKGITLNYGVKTKIMHTYSCYRISRKKPVSRWMH